jgi:hypothetical protein
MAQDKKQNYFHQPSSKRGRDNVGEDGERGEGKRERAVGQASRDSASGNPLHPFHVSVIFIDNYKFNHRSMLPRSGIRITQ